jgi:predicted DNA-binding transcriptional regulator AlpA
MVSVVNESDEYIIKDLAELPAGTILGKSSLASILGKDERTIDRMVGNVQIPSGVKLGNKMIWISDQVIDFIRERAVAETQKQLEISNRIGNPNLN